MSSTLQVLDINLEHLINRVLEQKIKENDRDYSHFHPSEFDQCHRKLVYKIYEAQGICTASNPRMIDPRLQRIFDNGHFLHSRLGQNLAATHLLRGVWKCVQCGTFHGKLEKLGIKKPKECDECSSNRLKYHEIGYFDEETLLGGHVDGILDLRGESVNGETIPINCSEQESNIIVDFKSMRAEVFRNLMEPKPNHYSQMQLYLYLSGLHFGKFLYENKNDQSFKEFLVTRNEDFIFTKVNEARDLKKIVTTKNSEGKRTLPPRKHNKNNVKECVECSFRSHCWKIK